MLAETQMDVRTEAGYECVFWQNWVKDCSPLELLQRIDLGIRKGRWSSRQEAFLDYASGALRDIGADEKQLRWTVRWLAQSLLDQAAEQERLSQPALAG
jgi:hypothetical protein